jgi:hypothetical protein
VTGLGEFSPNCLLWADFLKLGTYPAIPGYFFLHVRINFDENGLGHILGDFFSNSSGHPAFDGENCLLQIRKNEFRMSLTTVARFFLVQTNQKWGKYTK